MLIAVALPARSLELQLQCAALSCGAARALHLRAAHCCSPPCAQPRAAASRYLGCIVSAAAFMLLSGACAGFSGAVLCRTVTRTSAGARHLSWPRGTESHTLHAPRVPPLRQPCCWHSAGDHREAIMLEWRRAGPSEQASSTHSHAHGCNVQARRTRSRRLARRVHSATLGMLTVPRSTTSCSRRLRSPSRAALLQAARLTHVLLTPRQRRWLRWLRVRAQRPAQPGRQLAARGAGWRQRVRAGARRCLAQRLCRDLPPMVRP